MNALTVAEHFGEAELICPVGILGPQHDLVSHAMMLGGTRIREPVRMVQGEPCGGEEQHQHKADHAEIDVQPTRTNGDDTLEAEPMYQVLLR